MSNLKLQRLKIELKRLIAEYAKSDKPERDRIDLRVKNIKKEIEKIENNS